MQSSLTAAFQDLKVPKVPPIPKLLPVRRRVGRSFRTKSPRRPADSASSEPDEYWPPRSYVPYSPRDGDLPPPPSTGASLPLETLFPAVRRGHPLSPRNPGSVYVSAGATPRAVTTQLAERFPQIDFPQRVDAPHHLNAPKRRAAPTKETQVASVFSPTHKSHRAAVGRYDVKSYTPSGTGAGSGSGSPRMPLSARTAGSANRVHTSRVAGSGTKARDAQTAETLSKLKDATMLADACKRGGMAEKELATRFSIGVYRDNLEHHAAAIAAYRAALELSRRLGDTLLEGLACNCIGVDFHLLGVQAGSSEKATHLFERAVEFHEQHLAVADDAGQFVAYTNRGLARGKLGLLALSAQDHQAALQTAIKLYSPFGQSIAVGNLGLISARAGDTKTARACLDQHLSLVKGLKDKAAESHAYQQLGTLANATGDYRTASSYFQHARAVATRSGAQTTASVATCNLGVAVGNERMQEYVQGVVSRAVLPARAPSHLRMAGEPASPSPTRASKPTSREPEGGALSKAGAASLVSVRTSPLLDADGAQYGLGGTAGAGGGGGGRAGGGARVGGAGAGAGASEGRRYLPSGYASGSSKEQETREASRLGSSTFR